MVEQQAQKLRQKEALKKADEAYYQRISNQQASTSAQGKPKGDQEPSAAQVFLRRPPVPQVPSLLGQHQQRQAMQANPRLGLDRLKEYPWQVMCLPPREACARAGARPLQSEKLPSPPTHPPSFSPSNRLTYALSLSCRRPPERAGTPRCPGAATTASCTSRAWSGCACLAVITGSLTVPWRV